MIIEKLPQYKIIIYILLVYSDIYLNHGWEFSLPCEKSFQSGRMCVFYAYVRGMADTGSQFPNNVCTHLHMVSCSPDLHMVLVQ